MMRKQLLISTLLFTQVSTVWASDVTQSKLLNPRQDQVIIDVIDVNPEPLNPLVTSVSFEESIDDTIKSAVRKATPLTLGGLGIYYLSQGDFVSAYFCGIGTLTTGTFAILHGPPDQQMTSKDQEKVDKLYQSMNEKFKKVGKNTESSEATNVYRSLCTYNSPNTHKENLIKFNKLRWDAHSINP